MNSRRTTPALTAELRHAVTILRDAAVGDRSGDPIAIANAQRTLHQRRHDTRGNVRDAIDYYLDPNTYLAGPATLRQAISHLADTLGLSDVRRSRSDRCEQLTLDLPW